MAGALSELVFLLPRAAVPLLGVMGRASWAQDPVVRRDLEPRHPVAPSTSPSTDCGPTPPRVSLGALLQEQLLDGLCKCKQETQVLHNNYLLIYRIGHSVI